MDTQSWIGVPYVIWSAIIASGLTLLGVFLSNRNSRKQLDITLQHNYKQKEKERNHLLKKTIYLEASEAITRGIDTIMKLSDISIPDIEFSTKHAVDFASLNKIQLVGETSTAQLALNISNKFSASMLDIIHIRLSVSIQDANIKTLEEFRSESLDKQQHFLDLMTEYNINLEKTPEKFKMIDNNIKYQQSQFDKFSTELKPLYKQRTESQLELMKYCYNKVTEISEVIPDLIFAIRDEFELTIGKEEYMAYLNKTTEGNMDVAKQFFDKFEQSLNDDKQ